MSTSHLILGSLISNNRGRRRRRQQDRPKSRSEKPKTLHVHFFAVEIRLRRETKRPGAVYMLPELLSFQSEFMPSPYISLHLFT